MTPRKPAEEKGRWDGHITSDRLESVEAEIVAELKARPMPALTKEEWAVFDRLAASGRRPRAGMTKRAFEREQLLDTAGGLTRWGTEVRSRRASLALRPKGKAACR